MSEPLRSGYNRGVRGFVSIPVEERLARMSHREDGCIVWIGTKVNGYGRIRYQGRKVLAHRVAYELRHGPIPAGLSLDHLCRNPACINPDHLEPVTHRENILRGISPVAENARKTHCKRGHPLVPGNIQKSSKGGRSCLACKRVRWTNGSDRARARRPLDPTCGD